MNRSRLLLAVLCLLCSLPASAQQSIIQIQNNGTQVLTRTSFIALNFTTGCSVTNVSGVATIACSGTGGAGTVTQAAQTANGGATCGALSITGSPITTSGTFNLVWTGVQNDIITFSSTGCPQDSNTLLSSLAPLSTSSLTNYQTTSTAQAAYGGHGSCTNQAVTAANANAAPTCTTITSAYTDSSILNTGSSIGTQLTSVPQYAADSGAVNAYVVTLSPAATSYATGLEFCMKTSNANTSSAPTVNVSGLGAKTVVKWGGGAISSAGDISSTTISCFRYDGTNLLLLNPQASTGGGKIVGSTGPSITSGITIAGGITDTSIGMTTAAMTAQSSASCTNVTNMSWALSASKNYRLSCVVPVTFAASATLQFCLGGPGTATSYSLNADGPIGASAAYQQINTLAQTAWGTKTGASGAPGAAEVVHVDAMIQNGSTASGTNLTLQTAANGTNNITVGANAQCVLTQAN